MNSYTVKKTYPLTFMIIQTNQRMLEPKRYEISYELCTTKSNKETDANRAHNLSFLSIDMFLSMIDHSLIVSLEYLPDVDQLCQDYFDNNIIVLPEVIEGVLLAALHRKFNTIIDPLSTVNVVEIKDPEADLIYSLSLDDVETDILPEQLDWMGEYPYWELPWWRRQDISTYDNFAETKREQTKWRRAASDSNLDELSQKPLSLLKENINMLEKDVEQDGELIEVNFKDKKSWKPRLV